MVCDKCDANRDKGFAFCPDCGSPLDEGCPLCDYYKKEGYEFCGKCGRPLGTPKPAPPSSPLKMAALTAMPFVMILLVTELLFMIAGVVDVFGYLADYHIDVILLLPMITSVGTIGGTALQALWIAIFAILIAAFIVMVLQSKAVFRPRSDGDTSEAEKTPLYWFCLLFPALFLVQFALGLIFTAVLGDVAIPPEIADMDREQQLFEMANAAFWEEIISRVLIIGVPMAVLAACYGRKNFPAYLLGGFGMSRLALFLLVVSSLIFGFAHMGGWGAWKVIPTFIAGLTMGYLYIRFGVHVAMMFHFGIDYMGMAAVGDIGTMLLGGLVILLLIAGAVCLVSVLKKLKIGIREIPNLPVTGFEKEL